MITLSGIYCSHRNLYLKIFKLSWNKYHRWAFCWSFYKNKFSRFLYHLDDNPGDFRFRSFSARKFVRSEDFASSVVSPLKFESRRIVRTPIDLSHVDFVDLKCWRKMKLKNVQSKIKTFAITNRFSFSRLIWIITCLLEQSPNSRSFLLKQTMFW